MNVHFMKSRTLFRHSLSTNGNRLMAIVVQRNHQYYYGSNMDSCIYQRTIHSSIGNIPRSFAVNTMPIIRRPLHSSAAVNRWLFPLLSCHHLEQKRLSSSQLSGNIVSFNLSDIGEGIGEVVIKEWFVKEGDRVNQFDSICEVQSDKASVTITSRYDGIIHKIHYNIDDMAKVGQPLVDIKLDNVKSTEEGIDPTHVIDDRVADKFEDDYSQSQSSQILTTPAVRRMAMEYKIDLKDINGTGKDGRILKEDVINYMNELKTKPKTTPDQEVKKQPKQETAKNETMTSNKRPIANIVDSPPLAKDRIEPIKGITKSMFKTMTQSLSVPPFGLSEEIDMTELVKLRPMMKTVANERDIPLSYMPFMIKAASMALEEFPILNSSIDKSGENIIYKSSHNIGVAMDTKQGLLVPNIKRVNQLSVIQVAQQLNRLHELGKKGQLGTEDLSGGTFTLSNIGSIGGLFGIPVLMPGEVAIGAIGRVRQVPRFVDNSSDQIVRSFVMHVLWSADHRIIDGATMTRFNNRWKDFLENPFKILL